MKEVKNLLIMIAIIIPTLIGVAYASGKLFGVAISSAFESEPLEYTAMEKGPEPSPITTVMDALHNLDKTNTMKTAGEMAPSEELAKKYFDGMFKFWHDKWVGEGSRDYGLTYERYKEHAAVKSVSDKLFDMKATTDLMLRQLIDKGYAYRIDWPNIKYVGFTGVTPTLAEETKGVLYFEDQGRIFKLQFVGLYASVGEKTLAGAFIKELVFERADNSGAEDVKGFFKKLFN